ncbi:hypothetical protein J6590_081667 [Homalodisca vitripennis]|nr:hypothetical protein J6590_081667 [Homalodisca vitripennis]
MLSYLDFNQDRAQPAEVPHRTRTGPAPHGGAARRGGDVSELMSLNNLQLLVKIEKCVVGTFSNRGRNNGMYGVL